MARSARSRIVVVVPDPGARSSMEGHMKLRKRFGWRGIAGIVSALAVTFAVLIGSAASASAAGTKPAALPDWDLVGITMGSGPMKLDAYDYPAMDYRVVLRPNQNNDTQRWMVYRMASGNYRIYQLGTFRYLDAYDYPQAGWLAVTRPYQANQTQEWRLEAYGGGFYGIVQVSTGRYLQGSFEGDFQVTTQPWNGSNLQVFRFVSP
jgi:hypothetical protein